MNAADIMTRRVITVPLDASIADAIRLMLEQRISGLPVTDRDGRLVGILTEGDLLRRFETGTEKARPRWLQLLRGSAKEAEDYVRTHGRKVEHIMTREVSTVAETTPLERIVELMETGRIKRVPVLADGRLIGVVSRADLLRAVAKKLESIPTVEPSDTALRAQVVAEFRRHDWFGHRNVSVVVTGGTVYLEGVILDERERTAMQVAAENVEGVREVQDHLEYLPLIVYPM